jgi:hypothetical protein
MKIQSQNSLSRFAKPYYLASVIVLALVFAFHFAEVRGTLAISSDVEKSEGNFFEAGEWGGEEQCHLVINEVYYNVDSDHGKESSSQNDEWVEIFNPCEKTTINLKKYKIQDNSATKRTVTNSNLDVEPWHYVVLAKDAQTWTYWNIPSSADKINLGSEIGNGLANGGDQVILFDADENIVDAMSWGNDDTQLNPPCPNVDEGHSLQRIDNGKDTDSASDFQDMPAPTPGM